jgi:hypothetical protein
MYFSDQEISNSGFYRPTDDEQKKFCNESEFKHCPRFVAYQAHRKLQANEQPRSIKAATETKQPLT